MGLYVMMVLAAVGLACFWATAVFGALATFDFLASKLRKHKQAA
jgi:hypothetical protein